MESLSKILKYEDDALGREIYENTENLPQNEQSVQCYKNNLDNYGKEDCAKVYGQSVQCYNYNLDNYGKENCAQVYEQSVQCYTYNLDNYGKEDCAKVNEQSVQYYRNNLDNYAKEYCAKVDDNENNLLETLEEPKIQMKSSYRIFEDACIKNSDCGEPLKPQHIKIDFTPIPGVDDNVFLQQKCIDFWKIVNKHPKLQISKIDKAIQSSSNEIIRDKIIRDKISVDQGFSQEMEVPAINALGRPVIQQKAFPTIQKYTFCGHSQNEYIVGQIQKDTKVEQRQVKLKKRPSFSGLKPRSDFKDKSSITKSRGLDEVKMLCHKMDEWDLSHPRSMDTPNLAPSLRDLK